MSTTPGTASSPEVDLLNFPTRGDFNPTQLSVANFVGSIAQPLRPNAAVFSYHQSVSGSFEFGDIPKDGLIAALTLTGNKNFAPEALSRPDAGGNAIFDDNLNS